MRTILDNPLTQSALGKQTDSPIQYDPSLLYPVPRTLKRDDLQLSNSLPFTGMDVWTAYELSWLNEKNKPEIAIAEFIFPCDSPHLIESKSFKLYLHSLSETVFHSFDDIQKTLCTDLSIASGSPVEVTLKKLQTAALTLAPSFAGDSLDALDVSCIKAPLQVELLTTTPTIVEETLCSDLLRSNCLVTGQPDWGSIQITYRGPKINREGLLRYLISYRYSQGFHEHCVERIFMDILMRCKPAELAISAKYTRRGGLDISPYRSNTTILVNNNRLVRQ